MKKYLIGIAIGLLFMIGAYQVQAVLTQFTSPNFSNVNFPTRPSSDGSAPGYAAAFTATASSSAFAYVVQASRTCTIQTILVHPFTVTVSTTVSVSLQSVTTSTGNPSGSNFGSSLPVDVVVSTTNQTSLATLAATTSVNRGDIFAVVFTATSTATTTPNIAWPTWNGTSFPNFGTFPYIATQASSGVAYVHVTTSGAVPTAIGCTDGTFMYIEGTIPQNGAAPVAVTFASSTENALKFQNPWPATVCGMWYWGNIISTATTTYNLYDSDGVTVLASTSLPNPHFSSGGSVTTVNLQFPNPVNLKRNTNYILSAQPIGATAVGLYSLDMPASISAMLATMEGGTNYFFTSRTSTANGWTDLTWKRPMMGLKYCGFDNAPEYISVSSQ